MYTIYHIPGVKVGCSMQVAVRVKQQGYKDYEVLELVQTPEEASKKEIEWQEKLGYGRDNNILYQNTIKLSILANTEEARKKQKESLLSSTSRKEVYIRKHKPTLQLDKQGNFIREWARQKDISDALGICRSDICSCCKGRQKTAKGFIWKYKN